MIIWRGVGATVIVVAFLCSLAANLLANLFGGAAYWDAHGWPLACALMASAIIIWVIDARIAGQADRVLVDEKTGERVVLHETHDFFFLPMRLWSIICAVLAVLIFVTGFAPGAF